MRRLKSIYIAISCLLLLLIFTAHKVRGQSSSASKDTLTHNFVPVISYQSDLGFIVGGFYSRTRRSDEVDPYINRLRTSVLASTLGYLEGDVQYDWLSSFETDVRSKVDLYAQRKLEANFFGIGNRTTNNESRWKNEYYFFTSVNVGAKYVGRKPLLNSTVKHKELDWLWLVGVEYAIPYFKASESKFGRERPLGYTGGWLNYLGTGLLFDTRNRETDPRNGARIELKLKYAPSILLSDFQMGSARMDARYFFTFHLLRDVTVANRILMRHTGGDIPYWQLSGLGDDDQMRGYPDNRFLGNSMVVHSLELRTWLIQFNTYDIKIGGQLFMDTGRVFTPEAKWNDFPEGYKQTFGFGGALSLFNQDFVMRSDIGFSEDDFQIYIGMGYAF